MAEPALEEDWLAGELLKELSPFKHFAPIASPPPFQGTEDDLDIVTNAPPGMAKHPALAKEGAGDPNWLQKAFGWLKGKVPHFDEGADRESNPLTRLTHAPQRAGNILAGIPEALLGSAQHYAGWQGHRMGQHDPAAVLVPPHLAMGLVPGIPRMIRSGEANPISTYDQLRAKLSENGVHGSADYWFQHNPFDPRSQRTQRHREATYSEGAEHPSPQGMYAIEGVNQFFEPGSSLMMGKRDPALPPWQPTEAANKNQFAIVKPPIKGPDGIVRAEGDAKVGALTEQAIREQGYLPGNWYHGANRADRLVEHGKINPKRATSGPMPFFTDDAAIASNYAKNKPDTSRMAADPGDSVANYFTVSPKDLGHTRGRTPYTVEQSWHFLSPEQRATISDRWHRIGYENQEMGSGPHTLHKEPYSGIAGADHYNFVLQREAKGNPLKALRDIWHDGGSLVGSEAELANIYKLAGYPHKISQANAPWTEAPGVMAARLRIKNPVDTSNAATMKDVVAKLEETFSRDRSRKSEYSDADMWHKDHRWTPKEWVAQLKQDVAAGRNGYVWTSIPDKITEALRRYGYDGIIDMGGKMGGEGHRVAVPFSPTQVRVPWAKFDPAKLDSSNLLAARAGDSRLAGTVAQGGRSEPLPLTKGIADWVQMATGKEPSLRIAKGKNETDYVGLPHDQQLRERGVPRTKVRVADDGHAGWPEAGLIDTSGARPGRADPDVLSRLNKAGESFSDPNALIDALKWATSSSPEGNWLVSPGKEPRWARYAKEELPPLPENPYANKDQLKLLAKGDKVLPAIGGESRFREVWDKHKGLQKAVADELGIDVQMVSKLKGSLGIDTPKHTASPVKVPRDPQEMLALWRKHQGNARRIAEELGAAPKNVGLRIKQHNTPFRDAWERHEGRQSRIAEELGVSQQTVSYRARALGLEGRNPFRKPAKVPMSRIEEAMARHGGNQSAAARELGVTPSAIAHRLGYAAKREAASQAERIAPEMEQRGGGLQRELHDPELGANKRTFMTPTDGRKRSNWDAGRHEQQSQRARLEAEKHQLGSDEKVVGASRKWRKGKDLEYVQELVKRLRGKR